ncbi:hydantoinase B/oxoprolinase family protein [soil metagenome]
MSASERYDPITLRILWNRLIAIVDEAAVTLRRTSFSTLVRESNDFACVLLDRDGRSLVQNSAAIPSFIGTLPITVRHFLQRFPRTTLEPGDILTTNDPWLATGHLPDLTLAMPVFRNGEIVAIAASVAHLPDVGGRIRSADARTIFEEGLQVPPVKLFRAGEPNDLLFELFRQNTRVPDQVVGDIMAQVAANELAARRLLRLMDELDDDLSDRAAAIHQQSEQAMRQRIEAIPDGEYVGEVRPDGFEQPLRIRLAIRVDGDAITCDYDGTSEQVDIALNSVANYTFAYTAYPLKCLTSPEVPNNEGSFNPITVTAPEGTILNPRYPAPVGGRAMIGHFLSAAVFQALAPVLPEASQAPSGSPLWCLNLAGEHRNRQFAVAYFLNGGQGASRGRDGIACLSFPSNVSNTPIEVMETLAPVRVERKQIRRGSGGEGASRGGNGQDLAFRSTSDHSMTAAFLADRLREGPAGILGGGPGATGRVTVNEAEINPKRQYQLQPGDILTLSTPGGGGYGESGD